MFGLPEKVVIFALTSCLIGGGFILIRMVTKPKTADESSWQNFCTNFLRLSLLQGGIVFLATLGLMTYWFLLHR